MKTKTAHRRFYLIVLIVIGMWIVGCDNTIVRDDLEAIKARGTIRFITRNNAACYYEGPYGSTGFEYELAKAFAGHLNVELQTVVIEEETDMVAALLRGEADIIAMGMPFGRKSARVLALGPGYLEVRQQVVGRLGGPRIESIQNIGEIPIWTTGSSARLQILRQAKRANPGIKWHTLAKNSSEELLQMVWNQALPLTLVESNTVAMNRRYYPELVVHFSLGEPQQLTWATDPDNRRLHQSIVDWFQRKTTHKKIQGLTSHYYDHLKSFDYVDLARYRRRIKSRLPKYQMHFEEAAKKYELDWQLVAAQSYQESHWNPKAKSFTGVQGLMMVTLDTAKTLGLENRMAPEESILAGVRYLARLRRRVGDSVPEPDRTLMALAAYNIGFGHLRDARLLAKRLDKPADSWHGVRAVLPLLHAKNFYQTLEHGYARGREAVQYVDRIRTYHRVLRNTLEKSTFSEMTEDHTKKD